MPLFLAPPVIDPFALRLMRFLLPSFACEAPLPPLCFPLHYSCSTLTPQLQNDPDTHSFPAWLLPPPPPPSAPCQAVALSFNEEASRLSAIRSDKTCHVRKKQSSGWMSERGSQNEFVCRVNGDISGGTSCNLTFIPEFVMFFLFVHGI